MAERILDLLHFAVGEMTNRLAVDVARVDGAELIHYEQGPFVVQSASGRSWLAGRWWRSG